MKRPISLGLAPNMQQEDVFLAWKLFLSPWRYFQHDATIGVEQWFRQYFSTHYAFAFNSGRSGLYAILKCLSIGKDDEVILQAFTCVVVATPILAVGAIPVYVDIDHTLTLDAKDIEKKITKKTKAIIVQHTFGIPANMEKIMAIAKKYKIAVIEDAAHTIGGIYQGQKLGTIGTVGFFSLGRDKPASCVFGGVVVTNDIQLGNKLKLFQKEKPYPSFLWTLQQLFHPIACSFILPWYDVFSIGKIILVLLQKIHLLSFPVQSDEKKGQFWDQGVKRLPNQLATLALLQLEKINEYNKKRALFGSVYLEMSKRLGQPILFDQALPFLRFPFITEHGAEMKKFFRRKHVYLGNWYEHIVDPKGTQLQRIYYKKGSCPQAEKFGENMINLPTYPTLSMDEVLSVVSLVQDYVAHTRVTR